MDIPKTNKLFLRFFRSVIGPLFWSYFRLQCGDANRIAKEAIQKDRPLIIIFNHTSLIDMLAIAACADLDVIHQMSFPAKKELFEDWRTSWFVNLIGAIPLDRDITDITAVKTLLQILNSGRGLVIAPEGTRSLDGQIHPFKQGFIKLAHKTNALILPVAIRGAYEALPKGKLIAKRLPVELVVGELIDTTEHLKKRPSAEEYDTFLEQLRQTMIRMKETGKPNTELEPLPTV